MRKILSTDGTLGRAEADCLFELASQVKDASIVEVGSYRGKSSVALALGSQQGNNVPVYSIDPHESFTGVYGGEYGPKDRVAYFNNMLRNGCGETVRLINLPSKKVAAVWSEPIGLLWLDGDHSYDSVKSEFNGFSPFVVVGGYLAFHDSLDKNLGPGQVIAEAVKSAEFEKIAQVDLTTVLRKKV